jgi:hypothetical protein
LKILAPQVGLEPTTLRLTAECSAIELLRSVLRVKLAASTFYIKWLWLSQSSFPPADVRNLFARP